MPTVAAIGECMIELAASREHRGLFERRYGGDTLNTAVYLARLLSGSGIGVRYVTRLGDDPLSRWMIAGWREEGIDTSLVEAVAGQLPGLYMIDTDEKGERSFTYWRSEAPARDLFGRKDDPVLARLADDALYTSGITLAILHDAGRNALIALMARRKAEGGLVAFDTNFRSRLWPDRRAMRGHFRAAIASSTICLPSLEDLAHIFGETLGATQWIDRLNELGASEIVLKTGGDAAWTLAEGCRKTIPLDRMPSTVDTTGAGDSFNAGYLAARLTGANVETAVTLAHRLASQVVQYPGAIIPKDAMQIPLPLVGLVGRGVIQAPP